MFYPIRWHWLMAAILAATRGGRDGGAAEAKVQRGTVKLGGLSSEDQWTYVSKFGYAIGEGSYSIRLRLKGDTFRPTFRRWPPVVNFDIFLDEDWHKVDSLTPCRRARDAPARRVSLVDLNDVEGEWGLEQNGLLYQVMRPHIWYFALSDCKGELGNETVEIEYEFHAQQFDGSELSVEARHMPIAEGIALICLSLLVARGIWRSAALRRCDGALHPVVWALAAGVSMQYLSQVFHLIHLFKYTGDGVGVTSLEVLAEVLFMVSQVGHATLLIAIAQGYTLLVEKDCKFDLARLSFIATLAAHAALVCFSKLQESTSAHRHHKNDGFVGWAILLIRLFLFVWFVRAASTTKSKGGQRLQAFMSCFTLAGSMYFLAYPAVFLVAQVFAPYLRLPIMQLGLLCVQGVAALWLGELFLSRGAYFKVSTLSSSFLPGATGGGSPVHSIGLSKGD